MSAAIIAISSELDRVKAENAELRILLGRADCEISATVGMLDIIGVSSLTQDVCEPVLRDVRRVLGRGVRG